jgi:hypothetical protein
VIAGGGIVGAAPVVAIGADVICCGAIVSTSTRKENAVAIFTGHFHARHAIAKKLNKTFRKSLQKTKFANGIKLIVSSL